jgi:hypothetical protein
MKKLLLILPLLFLVSCGESFEDEYLLCKTVSVTIRGETVEYEDTDYVKMKDWKHKHTPDALIDLESTPPQEYPFIKKDEQGYRYFKKILYSKDGTENGFLQHKYHPIFGDMETAYKQGLYDLESSGYVSISKCTKAG